MVTTGSAKPVPSLHFQGMSSPAVAIRLRLQYRTRPVLEILKVIEREPSPPPETRDNRKRKRVADGSNTGAEAQREMLQVMLDMRVSYLHRFPVLIILIVCSARDQWTSPNSHSAGEC
jgi:hypothetical protein